MVFPEGFIETAAAETYTTLARRFPHHHRPVHRLGFCRDASEIMLKKLVAADYEAQIEVHDDFMRWHTFVVANPDIADGTAVELTWQQFLPREATGIGLPKFLVGSPAVVAESALAFGIEPSAGTLWSPESLIEVIR